MDAKSFFIRYWVLLVCLLILGDLSAQKTIPLYDGNPPGSIVDKNIQESSFNYAPGQSVCQNVIRPTLTVFLPVHAKATGTAVIICPGGGYKIVATEHEGEQVARAFQENGIAAFVLKYRLPDDRIMQDKAIGPLQDAQTAIKLVRTHANEWGISPHKIGIMGFSAGGHLAANAGTLFNLAFIDNPANVSLRPDFMALCYPVISLADNLGHPGSRSTLLGKSPSAEKIKMFSAEQNVTSDTPPAFIMLSQRDPGVSMRNGLTFFEQLSKNGVHAELHIYDDAEHGYGLNLPNTNEKWINSLINWLLSGRPFQK